MPEGGKEKRHPGPQSGSGLGSTPASPSTSSASVAPASGQPKLGGLFHRVFRQRPSQITAPLPGTQNTGPAYAEPAPEEGALLLALQAAADPPSREALVESLSSLALSHILTHIEEFWLQVEPLLAPEQPIQAQHTALRFIIACARGQYDRLGLVRLAFYDAIRANEGNLDYELRINAFNELTQSGRDITSLERSILGSLLRWAERLYVHSEAPAHPDHPYPTDRPDAEGHRPPPPPPLLNPLSPALSPTDLSTPHSPPNSASSTSITSSQTQGQSQSQTLASTPVRYTQAASPADAAILLARTVKLLQKVIQLHFGVFEEREAARAIRMMCLLCDATTHPTVARQCMEFLEVVVPYGQVPDAALGAFVRVLCRSVTTPQFGQVSWKIMQDLLGSHAAFTVIQRLCSLLEDKRNARNGPLLRGAVFVLGMSSWGAARVETLTPSYARILSCLLRVTTYGVVNADYEILINVNRLVGKFAPSLSFMEWDYLFDILHAMVPYLSKVPPSSLGPFRVGDTAVLSAPPIPPGQSIEGMLCRKFLEVLARLQAAYADRSFPGPHGRYLRLLASTPVPWRGESATLMLLEHNVTDRAYYPPSPGWMEALHRDILTVSPADPSLAPPGHELRRKRWATGVEVAWVALEGAESGGELGVEAVVERIILPLARAFILPPTRGSGEGLGAAAVAFILSVSLRIRGGPAPSPGHDSIASISVRSEGDGALERCVVFLRDCLTHCGCGREGHSPGSANAPSSMQPSCASDLPDGAVHPDGSSLPDPSHPPHPPIPADPTLPLSRGGGGGGSGRRERDRAERERTEREREKERERERERGWELERERERRRKGRCVADEAAKALSSLFHDALYRSEGGGVALLVWRVLLSSIPDASVHASARILLLRTCLSLRVAQDHRLYLEEADEEETAGTGTAHTPPRPSPFIVSFNPEAADAWHPRSRRNTDSDPFEDVEEEENAIEASIPFPHILAASPIHEARELGSSSPEAEGAIFPPPSAPKVTLPLGPYLVMLTRLLEREPTWGIFGLILHGLAKQCADRHLFCGVSSELDRFQGALCEQLQAGTLGAQVISPSPAAPLRDPGMEGASPSIASSTQSTQVPASALPPSANPHSTQSAPVSLKEEIQLGAYALLATLLAYRRLLSRTLQERLVSALMAGVQAQASTTIPCVHALWVCCHELPQLMTKMLPFVLHRMSRIISTTNVSVHLLEFLSAIAPLAPLRANFHEQEYQLVFAIALQYIRYNNMTYHGSNPSHPPTGTESKAFRKYVLLMAFRVITVWFRAIRLPDRRLHVPFITRRLLQTRNAEGSEQVEACLDMLSRHAYASGVDAHIPRPPPQVQGGAASRGAAGSERSWVLGGAAASAIISIRTGCVSLSAEGGWCELVVRRASGSTTMVIRVGMEQARGGAEAWLDTLLAQEGHRSPHPNAQGAHPATTAAVATSEVDRSFPMVRSRSERLRRASALGDPEGEGGASGGDGQGGRRAGLTPPPPLPLRSDGTGGISQRGVGRAQTTLGIQRPSFQPMSLSGPHPHSDPSSLDLGGSTGGSLPETRSPLSPIGTGPMALSPGAPSTPTPLTTEHDRSLIPPHPGMGGEHTMVSALSQQLEGVAAAAAAAAAGTVGETTSTNTTPPPGAGTAAGPGQRKRSLISAMWGGPLATGRSSRSSTLSGGAHGNVHGPGAHGVHGALGGVPESPVGPAPFPRLDPSFLLLQMTGLPDWSGLSSEGLPGSQHGNGHAHAPLYGPAPAHIPAPLLLPEGDMTTRALQSLDRTLVVEFHKIGVVYVGPGQTTEAEILGNSAGSLAYTRFLASLGELLDISVAQAKGMNTGGLMGPGSSEVPGGGDGQWTRRWREAGGMSEVLFHIPTMMPTRLTTDPGGTGKKRHIGNDFVTIVYLDTGTGEFAFDTLPSQFNFVHILVEPLPESGLSSRDRTYFRVRTQQRSDLPSFGPASEARVLSGEVVGPFVRQLALHANIVSQVWWESRGGHEYLGMGIDRLRQIKRLRDRAAERSGVRQRSGSGAEGSGPGSGPSSLTSSGPPSLVAVGTGQGGGGVGSGGGPGGMGGGGDVGSPGTGHHVSRLEAIVDFTRYS